MRQFTNPWGSTPFPVVPFKHLHSAQLGKMLQPNLSEGSVRVKYLNASQVQWGGVDEKQKFMYASPEDISKYGILPGDLLILEGGEVGRACFVVDLDEATIIQNSLHRVRGDEVDLRWLYYCMRHLVEIGWIEEISKASTISHLTGEKLKTIPLPNPPKSTKQRITAFLDEHTGRIDTLTAELKEFAETLKMQRKAMINECVTRGLPGERDREMRDTGIEWLGEIPVGWKVADFKYIFSLVKQMSVDANPTVLSLGRDGIKVRDISDNKGQIAASYDNYNMIKVGQFALNPMDLISGAVAISEFEGVLSNAYKVFTTEGSTYSREVNDRFYEYVLRWHYEQQIFYPFGKGQGRSEGSGGGRWTLNTETLRNFPLVLPPLPEQQRIAAFLDEQCGKLDELLAEIDNQIGLLAAYRKSLISEAVTGKIEV